MIRIIDEKTVELFCQCGERKRLWAGDLRGLEGVKNAGWHVIRYEQHNGYDLPLHVICHKCWECTRMIMGGGMTWNEARKKYDEKENLKAYINELKGAENDETV